MFYERMCGLEGKLRASYLILMQLFCWNSNILCGMTHHRNATATWKVQSRVFQIFMKFKVFVSAQFEIWKLAICILGGLSISINCYQLIIIGILCLQSTNIWYGKLRKLRFWVHFGSTKYAPKISISMYGWLKVRDFRGIIFLASFKTAIPLNDENHFPQVYAIRKSSWP